MKLEQSRQMFCHVDPIVAAGVEVKLVGNVPRVKRFVQSYGTGATSITVFYTLSGTATAGVDFATVSGSISVPRSGFSEVTITPLQFDMTHYTLTKKWDEHPWNLRK